ncbi:MAG: magnesium chelatase, partial [Actinomycetes bacterium]
VEIETLEDGREGQILDHLVRSAILTVFRERVSPENLVKVVSALEERGPIETGEDVASADYVTVVQQVPSLQVPVAELVGESPSPAAVASAVELVLEGLHLSKRLNKDASSTSGGTYRAR